MSNHCHNQILDLFNYELLFSLQGFVMSSDYETVCYGKGTVSRKAGEGSFVSLKKLEYREDLAEFFLHKHAYEFAKKFAQGNRILDVGCGNGYGASELSLVADEVTGIDFWKQGVNYCHNNRAGVATLVASGTNLPFADNSFDLVVSSQVIEHIDVKQVTLYLNDIKRVLRPKGVFVVATPNRLLRLLPFQKPWDPDHKKEYNAKELKSLLRSVFGNSDITGVFATKCAYFTEYRRVKQSPVRVYLVDALAPMLLRLLPNNLLGKSKALYEKRYAVNKKESERQSIDSCNFSLADFKESQLNLKSAITLYGVCEKT